MTKSHLALRLVLLALPAIFWSAVFAFVAGVGPVRRLVESIPDAAQVALTLACPALVVLLGMEAVKHDGRFAQRKEEQ